MTHPTAAGLGRLPGRIYDQRPRHVRQALLSGEISAEQFIGENMTGLPKTRAARFENKVKSYATASIVINRYWEYVQAQPIGPIMAKMKPQYSVAQHDERVKNFLKVMLLLLDKTRDRFIDEAGERHKAGGEMSEEDLLLLCFFAVARKRHRHLRGVPFPSMNDLIVFFGRLAQVAPAVFRRDAGREIAPQELFGLLRHPYMLKLCTELMSNDRKSTHPLFARLEGASKADLNDVNRTFDPSCFEIFEERGIQSLRIKSDIMAAHCSHYAKAAQRRKKRKKDSPRVLGCPVLYTGEFRNMYEWLCELFENWYLPAT